ncbi:MAG: hypothetical protein K2H01_03235 [Ruminococcus sp.]|nr:hypothetical protein [Ruminococcus sp.]
MKIEDIEVLASRNAPMPDKLTPPEIFLFLSLRAVYAAWRTGTVETSQAKNEKTQVIRQYKELDLWHRIYTEQSSMLRQVQRYSDKIRISGCPVCYGLFRVLSGLEDF